MREKDDRRPKLGGPSACPAVDFEEILELTFLATERKAGEGSWCAKSLRMPLV